MSGPISPFLPYEHNQQFSVQCPFFYNPKVVSTSFTSHTHTHTHVEILSHNYLPFVAGGGGRLGIYTHIFFLIAIL